MGSRRPRAWHHLLLWKVFVLTMRIADAILPFRFFRTLSTSCTKNRPWGLFQKPGRPDFFFSCGCFVRNFWRAASAFLTFASAVLHSASAWRFLANHNSILLSVLLFSFMTRLAMTGHCYRGLR